MKTKYKKNINTKNQHEHHTDILIKYIDTILVTRKTYTEVNFPLQKGK